MPRKVSYLAYEYPTLSECLLEAKWRTDTGWEISQIFCPQETLRGTWAILLFAITQEGEE